MAATEIKLGYGLDNIKFGLTRDELKALKGEPTEKDLYNASGEEDGYMTETWHYDDEEFSVSFDEEDNWRLTTISISSDEAQLFGKKIVGLDTETVINHLEQQDLGENELEDLSDESIKQQLVCYIASSLNLWFENNKLSEIQWGVFWADEDTPEWPN